MRPVGAGGDNGVSRSVGMTTFGFDALAHSSFTVARPVLSKYSSLMSYQFPATSGTGALAFSTSMWFVQLLITCWLLIHSRTPSSLRV